jgi:adenine-specific DNA-methyltransferase
MSLKHNLGQYFTTNGELKAKVLEFILNNPSTILEPSIGQGDLVTFVMSHNPTTTFDMFEIDTTIPLMDIIDKDKVVYGDFMAQSITKTYQTIIGNPPYVRTKKGNLYIDFTEKCVDLLDDNGGELIFIVPSDFLKLTSASKLLHRMMTNGTFTHIYHPHNENLFANASIDVIVFRYCKNSLLEKKVWYNGKLRNVINSNGLITFGGEARAEAEAGETKEKRGKKRGGEERDTHDSGVLFQDYFDIYVGLVSGKEEVYKNEELGNMTVLNGEDKLDKYIFVTAYPCGNKDIDTYLLNHKKKLIERGIRKFHEQNWFEWGAPRNMATINANFGDDCIYINNVTRKTKVAFIGKVTYFGGGLIMLKPKKTCSLTKVVDYMNSDTFKENFMFSGRFKIGHRQISNSYIPTDCLCL